MSQDGRTPLMHAVLNNDYDIAMLLLERGADANLADKVICHTDTSGSIHTTTCCINAP